MDRRRAFALLLAAVVAGCSAEPASDDAYDHVMSFDTARVRLISKQDTLPLLVELARSAEQRSMGLMERRRLADNAGMLFVYDSTQPPNAGFWMYRTRIPLDIAFLDRSASSARSARWCPARPTSPDGCPTYTPDIPYRYALELNAGFFTRRGIGVERT